MRSGSKEWASQTPEPGRGKSSQLRGGAGAREQADRALSLEGLGGPGFGMDTRVSQVNGATVRKPNFHTLIRVQVIKLVPAVKKLQGTWSQVSRHCLASSLQPQNPNEGAEYA
ncbi:unnamed protein product [Rangifer tarandus platyrhynchus]|uniref:Uncharacterized protein n=3 Tax=Rangifer tarandus platyrhynchus TaxID=3082113 RepID=A0AC59ZGR4_RANTA|nr:unnamed protein product [Rangifer tarandus platyrhynchus]CAI9703761.1 unnamed protein product [Rangifer tarandus platyrhynchus]